MAILLLAVLEQDELSVPRGQPDTNPSVNLPVKDLGYSAGDTVGNRIGDRGKESAIEVN